MKHLKLGELFCGAGGLAYGALQASTADVQITHAWANDYDPSACETYRNNICPNSPDTVVCCDVKDLDFTKLAPIDILAFGFPCNDFSLVGEHKGLDGNYGGLYKYGVKALHHFKPKCFIAENVSGIQSANDGAALSKILTELEEAGYTLTHQVYKFEEYGIPQTRHRLIVVGIRNDLGFKFEPPQPSNSFLSCKEAITNPPIKAGTANHEFQRMSEKVRERLKHIKQGENAFTADLPADLKLNVKGAKISQIYKRLDPNKPAYTVTANGGGGTHMYHWLENRALTNRERARLQTFPDSFTFSGSRSSVRSQIGMAVPCQVSRIFFSALVQQLNSVT